MNRCDYTPRYIRRLIGGESAEQIRIEKYGKVKTTTGRRREMERLVTNAATIDWAHNKADQLGEAMRILSEHFDPNADINKTRISDANAFRASMAIALIEAYFDRKGGNE